MRQLTTLKDEAAARRLAAWLVTQKIEARADKDADGFAVWVIDEDRMAAAKEQLAAFQADPNNARYRGAEKDAAALERAEQQRRERAHKNTVDMGRHWGTGIMQPRSQPLVLMLILASIAVFVLTDWGEQKGPGLIATLQFCGGAATENDQGLVKVQWVWADIVAGQVWRLVTPMFIHFGIMHIAFNMIALYDFGGQVESRIKSGWFLLLVLALAIISNVAQVVVDTAWFGTSTYPKVGPFGGMSGVVYGVFGFVFMRAYVLNDSRYFLRPGTSLMAFAWLFLCMARNFGGPVLGGLGSVANSAHVAGLLAGMALGYLPTLLGFKLR